MTTQAFPPMPPKLVLMRDGRSALLRPLTPNDEPQVAAFHRELSDTTVHFRYFHSMTLAQRTDHHRLAGVCHGDAVQDFAIAADVGGRIVAIGRLARAIAGGEAELAVVVADAWQRLGLGGQLVKALLDEARAAGCRRVVMDILSDNAGMERIAAHHGFTRVFEREIGVVHALLDLGTPLASNTPATPTAPGAVPP